MPRKDARDTWPAEFAEHFERLVTPVGTVIADSPDQGSVEVLSHRVLLDQNHIDRLGGYDHFSR